MPEARKIRLLETLSRRDHMRLVGLLRRQAELAGEIAQLADLHAQLEDLRTAYAGGGAVSAQQLRTNRWYLLRIEEETTTLTTRTAFLRQEIDTLLSQIAALSHRRKMTDEMARDITRALREAREMRQALSMPPRSMGRR